MKKSFLFAALLGLTACGDAITYPAELDGETAKAAVTQSTPVNSIQVTTADTTNGGKFVVVGPVDATVGKLTAFHPTPTVAQAEQKLRIEAAELGADAVISASISEVKVCALSWGCRTAEGIAVKFN